MTCTYIGPPSGPDPVAGPAYEIGYGNGYEAGHEAAYREMWRWTVLVVADLKEAQVAARRGFGGPVNLASANSLEAEVAQLRAWAVSP